MSETAGRRIDRARKLCDHDCAQETRAVAFLGVEYVARLVSIRL